MWKKLPPKARSAWMPVQTIVGINNAVPLYKVTAVLDVTQYTSL